MSGHSKWSTIKRQKAATDKKRGQIFTKLANAITLAVREGGGSSDPESNFRLRLAIDRARASNMPKSNIDRAIERAAGKTAATGLSEALYEGFGPVGVAVLVETVTDNKNRTQSEIRSTFSRHSGSIAGSGAVSHLFERVGIITTKKTKSYDEMLALALNTSVDDVEEDDDQFIIYTNASDLHNVKKFFEQSQIQIVDSILGFKPKNSVSLSKDEQEKLIKLLEALEDISDVQEVFTNANF